MTPRKMSAFNRRHNAAGNAGASTNGRWQTTTSQDPNSQEQDDIYGVSDKEDDDPPVKIATPKKAPAQVDQFSDPAESPDEFRMEHVKEQGITGFMIKMSSRLRTLKEPSDRLRVRHQFCNLMRELQYDHTRQPPYNHQAADKIRELLEERGLGETLLLDFELLLNLFEARAQKHREEVEKRMQEYEEEERKKQEWDLVKKEDAEDDWEMV